MRPTVVSSHLPYFYTSSSTPSETSSPWPTSTAAFAETRTLHERLPLPGTSGLHLVRSSSGPAPGALSTLSIRLTPSAIPPSLKRVLLSVRVAGRIFRRSFEADADLEFTYGWDRRNVYDQKVFGLAAARVSVGYQYRPSSSCPSSSPIWVTRVVEMRGFDVDISAAGEGWNLEIHHHYNSEQGEGGHRTCHGLLGQKSRNFPPSVSSAFSQLPTHGQGDGDEGGDTPMQVVKPFVATRAVFRLYHPP